MKVVMNDVVRIGREVEETVASTGRTLPADGLASVCTNPDAYGRVYIGWKEEHGFRVMVNQDWLHPVEPEVETVTLRLDAGTLKALRMDFNYFSDDSLCSLLHGLDVTK